MSGFSNSVLGGATKLIRAAIESPNFSLSPFRGWSIMRNGNAYFANATITGTISAGTFTGAQFIINPQGAFFYNGTPAAGNLIASIASTSGVDQYGNAYVAGVANYLGTRTAQLLDGAVFLNDSLGTDWSISAYVDGGVPYLAIGNAPNNNVLYVSETGVLTPPQPGTLGATPETWHALPLASGWTAAPGIWYRLTIDGKVELYGGATHAAFTTGTQLSTTGALAGAYAPARTWNVGGTGIPGRAGAEITVAGTVIAEANGTSCTECDVAGAYPLGL